MLRQILKNITYYVIWVIMGLVLLPSISSAELKAVHDLTVSGSNFHSVTLTWTSPGKTTFYDIRYSTSIIDTNSWDSASHVLGEPVPEEAGVSQSMTFSGLLPNTNYYFAMTSCDGDTNCSALSNMPGITTDDDDFIRYIVYENGEDGTIKRWIKDLGPPGITITNVYDEIRESRIIQFQGGGTKSKYRLHYEDGNMWNINTSQFENIVVKWSVRYSENFFVYFYVETDCDVENMVYLTLDAFIEYLQGNWDNQWDLELLDRLINEEPAYCKRGLYVYHFLDKKATDGQWHTFVRDLQADIRDEKPLGKILKVYRFVITNNGRVDDIIFGKAVNTGDDSSSPMPPKNVVAEVVSSSGINLSWDASTDDEGVAGYRIYRDGVEIGMSTNLSYEDKGLSPLTSYTYNVAAYDYAGNLSDNSKSVSELTFEASSEAQEQEGQEQGEAEAREPEEPVDKDIDCFIRSLVLRK